jgi:hypothetical protein
MLRSSGVTSQTLTVTTNDRTGFSSHFLGEAFKPKISSESALVVVQQNNFEFHLYRFYICYCKHFTDLAIKKNNFEFKLDRPVKRYRGTLLPPFPSLEHLQPRPPKRAGLSVWGTCFVGAVFGVIVSLASFSWRRGWH